MNWLVHHFDWILVGFALVLSAVWISNYIAHPLTELPTMPVINDNYVPPRVPLPRPSIPKPSRLS
jgi:hypothetical protein